MIDVQAVKALVDNGFVVIAAGGGGIPWCGTGRVGARRARRSIDKDLTAALLGHADRADVLVIATDVEAAVLRFGTPEARAGRRGDGRADADVRRGGALQRRVDGAEGRGGLPVRRVRRDASRHRPGSTAWTQAARGRDRDGRRTRSGLRAAPRSLGWAA